MTEQERPTRRLPGHAKRSDPKTRSNPAAVITLAAFEARRAQPPRDTPAALAVLGAWLAEQAAWLERERAEAIEDRAQDPFYEPGDTVLELRLLEPQLDHLIDGLKLAAAGLCEGATR
jgi:hypothetical protein